MKTNSNQLFEIHYSIQDNSGCREENWTPKAMAVPIQTPGSVACGGNLVEHIPEENEYSFEERRTGFCAS